MPLNSNILNFGHIASAVDFAKHNLKAQGKVFVWKSDNKFMLAENSYPLVEGDELIYNGNVFDFTELVKS